LTLKNGERVSFFPSPTRKTFSLLLTLLNDSNLFSAVNCQYCLSSKCRSYDAMWRDMIGELSEQLHIEGARDEEGGEGGSSGPAEVTIFQAFQHFACLYIKYLQIFRKLETCYDCMIHPQKRMHVKKVVELVARRIVELKMDLVKWNPPNSFVRIPPPG
jgi:hypothetical protein